LRAVGHEKFGLFHHSTRILTQRVRTSTIGDNAALAAPVIPSWTHSLWINLGLTLGQPGPGKKILQHQMLQRWVAGRSARSHPTCPAVRPER
jgi:hypothetical protein